MDRTLGIPSAPITDFPSSLGRVCFCCFSGLEQSSPRSWQHRLHPIASFQSKCKCCLFQAASHVTRFVFVFVFVFVFQCTYWYLKTFVRVLLSVSSQPALEALWRWELKRLLTTSAVSITDRGRTVRNIYWPPGRAQGLRGQVAISVDS